MHLKSSSVKIIDDDGLKPQEAEAVTSQSLLSKMKKDARVCVRDVVNFIIMLHQNHLSWRDDFFFFHTMSIPKPAETFMRINLNVPYYCYNYAQLVIGFTVPILLFYNFPFLVVLTANCVAVAIIMRKKLDHDAELRGCVSAYGYEIPISYFGHCFVVLWLIVTLFFDGLKTAFLTIVLNVVLVVPHALLRSPTFFDDEELEKLRPKLANYILMLGCLFLLYLEGDYGVPEDENLRRSAEERERIKAALQREPSSI